MLTRTQRVQERIAGRPREKIRSARWKRRVLLERRDMIELETSSERGGSDVISLLLREPNRARK